MPDSLYDTLGVPKGADRAAIRRAYRARAKKAHPDAGGTPQQFALVRHAHDVLIDQDRRARYDATGDDRERAPDQSLAAAMQQLSSAFDEAAVEIERRGVKIVETDFAAAIVKTLRSRRKQPEGQLGALRKTLAANEALRGRFKARRGPNLLDGMITSRLEQVRQAIAGTETFLGVLDQAIAIAEAHSFRFDAPAPVPDPITRMPDGAMHISAENFMKMFAR